MVTKPEQEDWRWYVPYHCRLEMVKREAPHRDVRIQSDLQYRFRYIQQMYIRGILRTMRYDSKIPKHHYRLPNFRARYGGPIKPLHRHYR